MSCDSNILSIATRLLEWKRLCPTCPGRVLSRVRSPLNHWSKRNCPRKAVPLTIQLMNRLIKKPLAPSVKHHRSKFFSLVFSLPIVIYWLMSWAQSRLTPTSHGSHAGWACVCLCSTETTYSKTALLQSRAIDDPVLIQTVITGKLAFSFWNIFYVFLPFRLESKAWRQRDRESSYPPKLIF